MIKIELNYKGHPVTGSGFAREVMKDIRKSIAKDVEKKLAPIRRMKCKNHHMSPRPKVVTSGSGDIVSLTVENICCEDFKKAIEVKLAVILRK